MRLKPDSAILVAWADLRPTDVVHGYQDMAGRFQAFGPELVSARRSLGKGTKMDFNSSLSYYVVREQHLPEDTYGEHSP